MSSEDQREMDRWIKANAILGSIVAVGMLAMAFLGSNPTGHAGVATTVSATNIAASR
jgi:hypothetical protein